LRVKIHAIVEWNNDGAFAPPPTKSRFLGCRRDNSFESGGVSVAIPTGLDLRATQFTSDSF
jgi:hypothetical protein